MIFLRVDRDILVARLAERHGHFFRPELLDSQLAATEVPLADERAIVVDANEPPADVVREIILRLGLSS